MNEVIHGDCLEVLRKGSSDAIDLIVTDPPYGYSFMGKDWDKAVVGAETWKECLRVLKPGAFAFIMSAPRQDVLGKMIANLTDAGFKTDFTSIYWTYASGFPKAANIGKMVDKRLGVEREKLPNPLAEQQTQSIGTTAYGDYNATTHITPNAVSDEAKALDGSYGGFQPKPAVEVILVAMKPLSEKTYVDQALANGKGVTWLDNCRFPTQAKSFKDKRTEKTNDVYGKYNPADYDGSKGRFPANLLVSDDVLNDGVERKAGTAVRRNSGGKNIHSETEKPAMEDMGYADSGSFSRFFSLDAWAKTFPFLIVPKASKREKNEGLEGFPDVEPKNYGGDAGFGVTYPDGSLRPKNPDKNTHATVKPLKLMSYLITLGSRPGDVVLDPFLGSGTTVCAAKMLGRKYIGIEREAEYVEIAKARVAAIIEQMI